MSSPYYLKSLSPSKRGAGKAEGIPPAASSPPPHPEAPHQAPLDFGNSYDAHHRSGRGGRGGARQSTAVVDTMATSVLGLGSGGDANNAAATSVGPPKYNSQQPSTAHMHVDAANQRSSAMRGDEEDDGERTNHRRPAPLQPRGGASDSADVARELAKMRQLQRLLAEGRVGNGGGGHKNSKGGVGSVTRATAADIGLRLKYPSPNAAAGGEASLHAGATASASPPRILQPISAPQQQLQQPITAAVSSTATAPSVPAAAASVFLRPQMIVDIERHVRGELERLNRSVTAAAAATANSNTSAVDKNRSDVTLLPAGPPSEEALAKFTWDPTWPLLPEEDVDDEDAFEDEVDGGEGEGVATEAKRQKAAAKLERAIALRDERFRAFGLNGSNKKAITATSAAMGPHSDEEAYRRRRIEVLSSGAKLFADQFKSYRRLLLWIMTEYDAYAAYCRDQLPREALRRAREDVERSLRAEFSVERAELEAKIAALEKAAERQQEHITSLEGITANGRRMLRDRDDALELKERELGEAAEGRAALLSRIHRLEKELWAQKELSEEPERRLRLMARDLSDQQDKCAHYARALAASEDTAARLRGRLERAEEAARERAAGEQLMATRAQYQGWKRREVELLELNASLGARNARLAGQLEAALAQLTASSSSSAAAASAAAAAASFSSKGGGGSSGGGGSTPRPMWSLVDKNFPEAASTGQRVRLASDLIAQLTADLSRAKAEAAMLGAMLSPAGSPSHARLLAGPGRAPAASAIAAATAASAMASVLYHPHSNNNNSNHNERGGGGEGVGGGEIGLSISSGPSVGQPLALSDERWLLFSDYIPKLGLDTRVPSYLKGIGKAVNYKLSRAEASAYCQLLWFEKEIARPTVPWEDIVAQTLRRHCPPPLSMSAASHHHNKGYNNNNYGKLAAIRDNNSKKSNNKTNNSNGGPTVVRPRPHTFALVSLVSGGAEGGAEGLSASSVMDGARRIDNGRRSARRRRTSSVSFSRDTAAGGGEEGAEANKESYDDDFDGNDSAEEEEASRELTATEAAAAQSLHHSDVAYSLFFALHWHDHDPFIKFTREAVLGLIDDACMATIFDCIRRLKAAFIERAQISDALVDSGDVSIDATAGGNGKPVGASPAHSVLSASIPPSPAVGGLAMMSAAGRPTAEEPISAATSDLAVDPSMANKPQWITRGAAASALSATFPLLPPSAHAAMADALLHARASPREPRLISVPSLFAFDSAKKRRSALIEALIAAKIAERTAVIRSYIGALNRCEASPSSSGGGGLYSKAAITSNASSASEPAALGATRGAHITPHALAMRLWEADPHIPLPHMDQLMAYLFGAEPEALLADYQPQSAAAATSSSPQQQQQQRAAAVLTAAFAGTAVNGNGSSSAASPSGTSQSHHQHAKRNGGAASISQEPSSVFAAPSAIPPSIGHRTYTDAATAAQDYRALFEKIVRRPAHRFSAEDSGSHSV